MDEKPFRVLITGGRDADNKSEVQSVFSFFIQDELIVPRGMIIVHGDCPTGVDAIMKEWADQAPLMTGEPHPAEDFGPWPRCGPIRNSHMVSLGADLCIAMPTLRSKGTWDCAEKAARAGIPVRLWTVSNG